MVLLNEQFEEAKKKYGCKTTRKDSPTYMISSFGGLSKLQEMLIEGYSVKEISKIIGVKANHVYSYINNHKSSVYDLRRGDII